METLYASHHGFAREHKAAPYKTTVLVLSSPSANSSSSSDSQDDLLPELWLESPKMTNYSFLNAQHSRKSRHQRVNMVSMVRILQNTTMQTTSMHRVCSVTSPWSMHSRFYPTVFCFPSLGLATPRPPCQCPTRTCTYRPLRPQKR